MMTPGDQVRAGRGDAPAVVMVESGETITHRELDARSMRLARRLHAHGVRPGGHVAVLLENHPRWFEVYWAAMRSGLYFAPISWHLDVAEVGAMVEHCGATVLVTSAGVGDVARSLGARRLANVTLRLVMDGDLEGWTRYEDAIASQPAEPLDDERQGEVMFYSAGTTGRPKALEPPLSDAGYGERPNALAALLQMQFGFGPDTVFLCVGPMYHAGPTGMAACVQRLGGTVLLMDDFDAERVLDAIETHQVTHALFVPMHFVRLLALPDAVRNRHDLTSLRVVLHGAGPCPVDVKERMIDWWGKVLHEYYVAAEGNSFTVAGPDDWLAHRGTVGKPLTGSVHIVGDDGTELGAGESGQIWFETGAQFEYHLDPEATRAAVDDRGWTTWGDWGHVDEEGWLYVTGRVAELIRCGGATVSPQEVEDVIAAHPAVADVAVVGVPDDGLGEVPKAFVLASAEVSVDDLAAWCRERLDDDAVPRAIELVDRLPRLPTGKMLKRLLPDGR